MFLIGNSAIADWSTAVMTLFQSNRIHSFSLLFGEYLFLHVYTWLLIKSICDIDVAIWNANDRLLWKKCLGVVDAPTINDTIIIQ